MLGARKTIALGAAALVVFAVAGCSDDDGPKVVKVSGTLTHNGAPVPSATIHFTPEKGRMSWAVTDERGRFKVNYDAHQDGAVVGKHKVYLEYRPSSAADTELVMQGLKPKLSKEMTVLFDKYSAEKSTLTVEITKATDDLKIELE